MAGAGVTKSRNIIRPRWRPTEVDIELVRRNFATSRTQDLADALGVAYHQVGKLANKLGLCKDDAWLNGPQGGRLDGVRGMGTRFQPGQPSPTKGIKRPGHGDPSTWFKPGQKPSNYMPVGSLRLQSTGYLQIKVSETGYPPKDWEMYHRYVWTHAHGPIPPGHIVAFKDGRRRTTPEEITLDVLELRSRREHIARHTYHQYGPEVARVVQLRAAITRQINQRTKATQEESK